MEGKKYGEYIAKIIGKSTTGLDIKFQLKVEEVKHIRRVIIHYDRFFKREYKNYQGSGLNKEIYDKFRRFGKIGRNQTTKNLKKKLKNREFICSYNECNESENLTIDHIKRKNWGENPNRKENLQLLCPKHHLLKELKTNLFHKELEKNKIKKRIEDIEKRDTTDCLGYKVIDKNKFESLDD